MKYLYTCKDITTTKQDKEHIHHLQACFCPLQNSPHFPGASLQTTTDLFDTTDFYFLELYRNRIICCMIFICQQYPWIFSVFLVVVVVLIFCLVLFSFVWDRVSLCSNGCSSLRVPPCRHSNSQRYSNLCLQSTGVKGEVPSPHEYFECLSDYCV